MFLGVSRSGVSRLNEPPEPMDNQDFKQVKAQVFAECESACAVCGFSSNKYQHGHHLDGNHRNNAKSNIECRDPLCHYCEHLGFVGSEKMGQLVYCDSLSQAEINCIQRIAWVSEYQILNMNDETISEELMEVARYSKQVIELLKPTSFQVLNEFEVDGPTTLANIFLSMSESEYQRRELYYKPIRLLFEPSFFSKEIKHWSENTEFFAGFYSINGWGKQAQNMVEMK